MTAFAVATVAATAGSSTFFVPDHFSDDQPCHCQKHPASHNRSHNASSISVNDIHFHFMRISILSSLLNVNIVLMPVNKEFLLAIVH